MKSKITFKTKACLLVALFFLSNIHAQSWTQIGGDIDGEDASDNSGAALSMSDDGSTIVIGAFGNDGSINGSGHARVYELTGGVWVQKGMDIDGEGMYDGSGCAVSMNSDGSVIAIGAMSNSDGGSGAGHVRVYEWNGSSWVQKGGDIDGGSAYEESGNAISMDATGNTLIIGASKNDDVASNAGQVRIFDWNGTAWIQKGLDINGDAANDSFGTSVSMSNNGTVIAVGAPMNSGTFVNGGQVKIYEWNTTAWVQKGNDIGGEEVYDRFGFSVSLSADGNVVAIGAIWNSDNGTQAGHVRIYEWNSTAWVQKGADIDGEAYNDNSGWSVSLNADGNTVAIGAKGNDGTTGFNAVQGHVRVYGWNSTSWIQVGDDIDGEADPDYFGTAVEISADGSIVAGGGPWNVGNGTSSGSVRVFEAPDYTSIGDNEMNVITVFPNPASNQISVDLTGYGDVKLVLSDISGRVLLNEVHQGEALVNLDLSCFESGIYLLTIESDGVLISSQKLIIE